MKQNFNGMPVNNDIMQQFDKQRSRGVQGFGLFDAEHFNIKKSANEDTILKWLVDRPSSHILFHHRWPTSTVNVKRAAHPMTTGDYFGNTQYIMVHNGYLLNDYALYEDHQELGIEYKTLLQDGTFNDSESLMWDIALTLEGKQKELEAVGDMAFIMMKKVDGALTHMYFGRNQRPLNMHRSKDTLELSSEGRGAAIDAHRLYTWNYKTKRLTNKAMEFPANFAMATQSYTGKTYSTPTYATPIYDAADYDDEYYDEYYKEFGTYPHGQPTTYSDGNYGYYTSKAESEPTQNWLGKPLQNKFKDFLLPARTTFVPIHTQASEVAFDALIEAKGHFEQAYWVIESRYNDTFEYVQDLSTTREQTVLECAMEIIEKDPEYVDVNSVSSAWETICT